MATNWIIPALADLYKVLSSQVIGTANENIDENSIQAYLANPTLTPGYRSIDPTLDDRGTEQIILAVLQFRGAIQIGGKFPLSLTAGSIPPEVFTHVLYLAAFGLVNSTPNLQMVVIDDKAGASPLQVNFKEATYYLSALRKGRNIALPSDPTGQDYINPVQNDCCQPLFNPCLKPVRFGGSSFPVDLNTWGSRFPNYPEFFPTEELGQP